MTNILSMLETHPQDLNGVNQQKLAACIAACLECSQACIACADACLSEDRVADLTKCIRINQDCAAVCGAVVGILSRHAGYETGVTRAVLEACAAVCRACAEECDRHAEMHEHCRICAESCRRCEMACNELLGSLERGALV